MNANAATPAPAAERARATRRAGSHGRILVGDWVGQRAADAALAVRRAGLRPALERSLGGQPELFGRVVTQKPPAGGYLVRNGSVSLYVAAPSATPGEYKRVGEPGARSGERGIPSAATERAVAVVDAAPESGLRPCRRRKPRRLRRIRRAVTAHHRPRPAEANPSFAASHVLTVEDPTAEWVSDQALPLPGAPDDIGGAEEVIEEGLCGERPLDELVAHADEVFAGRAGFPWREGVSRARAAREPSTKPLEEMARMTLQGPTPRTRRAPLS
jgi:hypothetical protein